MRDKADFGTGLRAHLQLAPKPVHESAPEPQEASLEAVARDLDERLDLLAVAHASLDERERTLAQREAALDEEARRLHALRSELSTAGPGTDARTVLRERAEQHAEQIWRIFEDALAATDPATRLAAARALLAEAYPES